METNHCQFDLRRAGRMSDFAKSAMRWDYGAKPQLPPMHGMAVAPIGPPIR